ncbi:MAG: N-acetylmuramoyl-L-alanine amidase [Bacteroidales bacterium]|nr:N-acetylmuramoyl-L-alanine amidase [Candidatus Physcocola equi]
MSKQIQYLVIHCTGTRAGREVTSSEIRHWHTDPVSKGGRGWKQVGYTDMFHLDGRVERLVKNNEDANVDSWEITNGAIGYNQISRHIVYVGGCDAMDVSRARDTRTPAQKESLKRYVLNFHKRFPKVKIIGHNQVANKACPSFDVPKWLKEIGINQK